jgi:hypothetical protein
MKVPLKVPLATPSAIVSSMSFGPADRTSRLTARVCVNVPLAARGGDTWAPAPAGNKPTTAAVATAPTLLLIDIDAVCLISGPFLLLVATPADSARRRDASPSSLLTRLVPLTRPRARRR